LEKTGKNKPEPLVDEDERGFKVYSESLTKGKKVFAFVLAKNKLFLWDQDTIKYRF